MNDRSRISPCGIYRRGSGASACPRAPAHLFELLYIPRFFIISISFGHIRARARVPQASSPWRREIHRALPSYLFSRERKSLVRIGPRFPTLNVEWHPISTKEIKRYREMFFKHTFVSYRVAQYLRNLNELPFYRKHCEDRVIIKKKRSCRVATSVSGTGGVLK